MFVHGFAGDVSEVGEGFAQVGGAEVERQVGFDRADGPVERLHGVMGALDMAWKRHLILRRAALAADAFDRAKDFV